jgi:hypothetical protein
MISRMQGADAADWRCMGMTSSPGASSRQIDRQSTGAPPPVTHGGER